jgi:hypothetical protein
MVFAERHLPRFKRNVAKNMSVAIAVHAKNSAGLSALIFASDSRNTDGNTQADDVRKVHVINFENVALLVAETGCSGPSGMAIMELKKLAHGTSISDSSDIQECVIDAIRIIFKRRSESYPPGMTENEKYRDRMEDCQFNLLIGFIWRGEVMVFDCESTRLSVEPRSQSNAAIGKGAELAKYFLREFCSERRRIETAITTATYVVRQVSKHTPGCGGPVQVCFLDGDAQPNRLNVQQIAHYAEGVDSFEKELHARHQAAMIDALNQLEQKQLNAVAATMGWTQTKADKITEL